MQGESLEVGAVLVCYVMQSKCLVSFLSAASRGGMIVFTYQGLGTLSSHTIEQLLSCPKIKNAAACIPVATSCLHDCHTLPTSAFIVLLVPSLCKLFRIWSDLSHLLDREARMNGELQFRRRLSWLRQCRLSPSYETRK